jgi:hypothetical protein
MATTPSRAGERVSGGFAILQPVESFEASIVASERGGAYVEVPPAVTAALGGKARVPVRATFDGVPYRGSIVSMGGDARVLGILKDIRAQLGKAPGDRVKVTVERDDAERAVVVPDDLVAALDDAGLTATFGRLSYSHQREYVGWIEDAKKPQTRHRRVAETIERLEGRP